MIQFIFLTWSHIKQGPNMACKFLMLEKSLRSIGEFSKKVFISKVGSFNAGFFMQDPGPKNQLNLSPPYLTLAFRFIL